MRHTNFIIFNLITLLMLFGVSNSPVSACEPLPPSSDNEPVVTLEDHVNHANWIMVGTVIGGTEDAGVITQAEIEVERYLKGDGSAIVHINGFGHSTACLATVSIGDTYIFFAEGNLSDTYRASYFENRHPIALANQENIERVIAVTNQSLAPDPLPLNIQIERAIGDTLSWKLLAIILSGMMLGVLGIITFRGGKRKTKAKRT